MYEHPTRAEIELFISVILKAYFVLWLELQAVLKAAQARFKRRILHAPNQILILVDSNEYAWLIWFKRRIILPNKIIKLSA